MIGQWETKHGSGWAHRPYRECKAAGLAAAARYLASKPEPLIPGERLDNTMGSLAWEAETERLLDEAERYMAIVGKPYHLDAVIRIINGDPEIQRAVARAVWRKYKLRGVVILPIGEGWRERPYAALEAA